MRIALITAIACSCAVVVGAREELLTQLKGRYNYASSDCAARVLASNKGCKSPHAILHSAMDTYLRNLCSYNDKHVIIELCQDIRVDTIVLANFEYFSSMVKDFRVSVSKKYPPPVDSGWRLVGSFVGENSRREQVFLVEAKGYARYLRIDFDSHHGNEYYCLLSVLRVYGKTMMEDFEESNNTDTGAVATKEGNASDTNKCSEADIPIESSKRAINYPPTQSQDSGKGIPAEVSSESPLPPSSSSYIDVNVSSLDLWKLFQSQASHYCKATFSASSSATSTFEAPLLPQENIFKAIHDRLQMLERNMTRSARSFEVEIGRISGELEGFKGEIGVISSSPSPATNSKETISTPKSNTFRAKLLQHLERKNHEFSAKLLDDIEDSLGMVESNERIIFWLAILTFLQITGLLSVVVTGYLLGWFGQSTPLSTPQPTLFDQSIPNIPRHQRRHSTSDVSVMAMDDSIVPDNNINQEETFHHGLSPARSDLLTNARPLLLDESEAEIIDAVFFHHSQTEHELSPSPLSSPSANVLMKKRSSDALSDADPA